MKRIIGSIGLLGAILALGGTTPASADDAVLGPTGYKSLYLGQSEANAEATGLLVDKQPGVCDRYYLRPSEGRPNPGSGVFIDRTLGVVMIGGTTKSHTPEGITMNSAFDTVHAAYPDLTPVPPTNFVYRAHVPGHTGLYYQFAFDNARRVRDFGLVSENMGAC